MSVGFLSVWFITQQLLLYLNEIFQATSQGRQTDFMHLDFRKAFDSVPHNKLLAKLPQYGIMGSLWYWFRNYLYNRIQNVKVLSGLVAIVQSLSQPLSHLINHLVNHLVT